MDVRVVTLRYQESVQGFVEEAVTRATAGREVLDVREHFFVYGNVPHLTLVLLVGDTREMPRRRDGPDPGDELPDERKALYRTLRTWRNERARADGVPSYVIARNVQLVEICRRLPRSLAELKEVEGIGEATCEKYGRDLLARIPPAAPEADASTEKAEA
jgi:superfamily II DNA helicase RecQ